MIPNMKFYVISIVAIFAALGIGIYIGFALDTGSFVVEQREDIVQKLEERFDYLRGENQNLKLELKELELENENCKIYMDSTYEELVKNRLSGAKIGIIETVDDYMYSGVGQILEAAGATVVNVVTINENIMEEDALLKIYEELNIDIENLNLISNTSKELSKGIINGENSDLIKKLEENRIIDIVGLLDEPVDYLVIAGGSVKENPERLSLVDKIIIDTAKSMEKEIVGIEKSNINYSYIDTYKSYKISTIDNIDMIMGKVSLVLALEGRPGHYGIKPTAEDILPNLKLSLVEYPKER